MVTPCKGKPPRLSIMQVPATESQTKDSCWRVQYFVQERDWLRRSNEVTE